MLERILHDDFNIARLTAKKNLGTLTKEEEKQLENLLLAEKLRREGIPSTPIEQLAHNSNTASETTHLNKDPLSKVIQKRNASQRKHGAMGGSTG